MMQILRHSRLYESKAAYVENQPKFLNAALAVHTQYSAHELLKVLKSLEVCSPSADWGYSLASNTPAQICPQTAALLPHR